jgi:hypothetical protein
MRCRHLSPVRISREPTFTKGSAAPVDDVSTLGRMSDQGWGQPQQPQQPPSTKKTEPAAVAAFVLSLCGLFTWGLSCVVALFLGPMAKRNISVDPTNRKGNDLVLAAMIISGITIAIIVLITLSLAAA